MGGRLSDGGEAATPITRAQNAPALRAPTSVSVVLRADGKLPAFEADAGPAVDPSPLRGLSVVQRQQRLIGLLELLASYGDGAAAAAALTHYRWQTEMRRGKPPQRVDLAAAGSITVVDTLSAPAGTPLPNPRRFGRPSAPKAG